jgi:hypothetical protein
MQVTADRTLMAFWIEGPDPKGPLGYGVTAFSIVDAFDIVERAGYRLPQDKSSLRVRVDIKPADIEHTYVREHMGPIVVRGLWYPFTDVGVGA